MATDANYDLSANLYVGHVYAVLSRVIHKSDEQTMENEKTAFITESRIATGNTTLSFYSEVPYRGGYLVTIVLS